MKSYIHKLLKPSLVLMAAASFLFSCNKELPPPEPIAPPAQAATSIIDALDDPSFSILKAAVNRAGSKLKNLISDKSAVFTFFAPTDAAFASRLTFLLVGLWWFGFAQITYSYLPNNVYNRKPKKDFIWKGLRELKVVYDEMKQQRELRFFLMSFFMFSVGVQTIILMAGIFGSKELGLPTLDLIAAILLVQIVAIFGAFLFSRISDKIGNISTLKITISIWALVCCFAFLLDKSQENVSYYFFGLGALIGLVMGAIQSLARSTYSKLLPETKDHATYFSFYDVTEKLAIVFGMIVFGLLISITGSMQFSVLFLAIFFIISFVLLYFVGKTKYVQ